METLQPKLRFQNFNEGLLSKKIGDICDLTTGNKDTKNKVDDGKYPFFVRSQTVERINSFCYDGEAILTSGDGVGVGKNFHYINGKFDYHQRVYCLHEFKEGIFGKYVYHYFSEKFLKRITRMNAKNSVDSVRREMIFDMPIFIPSLEEQTKIANFLSSVDEKLNLLKEKKELLEDYKKGIMQKIFNQDIRFKDDNGNDFEDWEIKTLGEIGNTFNGLTGKTKEDFGIGKPYIQYKQIFDNSKINIDGCQLVDINEKDNQNKVQFGDVFFTVSSETQNEIGTASVLLDNVKEMYLNSFCFGYRANSLTELVPEFSRYLFRNELFRNDIIKLAQGSTRYNMSKVGLMKLKIMLPKAEEQTKIANFLSAIDEKIELVSTQIQDTQEYKKGLLQQMFV